MSVFNLAWFIPCFPFLAFVAISLFAHRNRTLSHRLAIGGISLSFLLSQIVFWTAVLLPVGGGEHAFESAPIHWLSTGTERLTLAVYVDPATTVMLLMVPLVCLMAFIYSVGYMQGDPRYSRFFAYISLLAAGMLGLVVFNNLLAFFICWEIMGTCTYLLISFRYEKKFAYQAALKAFLVTKVGDLFFILGLAVLYAEVGSLAYRDIFQPETLDYLAHTPFLATQWPIATVVALLLFGAAVGKAAQFPLHIWLPDAMEAPGPASALIHAATIDSAAVFLMVRAFPIFAVVEGSAQMVTVGLIGAFTAIFASAIAIAQRDIKRVLAYSTISQLGYIVAALGIGAYVAGTFHLIIHAFFKALLFLGAGSVVQGMERGHHHRMLSIRAHDQGERRGHGEFNPRDMLNMGGLAKRMPTTFWTFIAGGLTLSGLPLVTAGFWSKDRILAHAWEVREIFWALAISASFTAFYTMRQICLTFFGQPRTREAALARESAPLMTVPLIVLAVFAMGLGWVGVTEDFPAIGGWIPDWVHHFVISTVEPIEEVEPPAIAPEVILQFEVIPLVVGVILELGGLTLGWLIYGRRPMQSGEMDRVWAAMRRARLGWLFQALRQRFYIDELYQATFVRVSILLADLSYAFDHNVIDGLVNLIGRAGRVTSRVSDAFDLHIVDRLVNGVGDAVKGAGRLIRPIQTGRVQNYLLLASTTVMVLIVTFFVVLFLQL